MSEQISSKRPRRASTRKPLRSSLLLVMVALGAACAASTPDPVNSDHPMAWLVGCWRMEQGARVVVERWNHPRGRTLLGTSQTIENGDTSFYEYLRLAPAADGRLTYYASPMGAKATPFLMVAHTATSARFENPAHDFPQRIEYARRGTRLDAAISGLEGGETRRSSWSYGSIRCGE